MGKQTGGKGKRGVPRGSRSGVPSGNELPAEQSEVLEAFPEIRELPPRKRDRLAERLVATLQVSMHHSGPLPPAETLQGYEIACKGAADRVIKMAERQQEHRITLEDHAVREGMRQSGRGQIFGFILGLVGLVGGAATTIASTAIAGQISGGVMATGSLVALVALFVKGKEKQRAELEQKSK